MTCLFYDVDKMLLTNGTPCNSWSIGKPAYDMEYADDTVLMGATTSQFNFFCALFRRFHHCGMFFNADKTYLVIHPDRSEKRL